MIRKLLVLSVVLNLLGGIAVCKAVWRFGGIKQVWSLWTHDKVPSLYRHRMSHFMELPVQKNAVVFLGDSQTEQAEWHEMCNTTTRVVLNRGISGDHIGGVQQRLDEVLRHEPSVIFLQVGINDLFFKAKPDQLAAEYADLIQTIRSRQPGAQIVVQSLPPVNNNIRFLPTDNATVRAFNEQLARIAKSYALPYADLYTPLADSEGRLAAGFTSDGLHLNGSGYRVWFEVIKPYLPPN